MTKYRRIFNLFFKLDFVWWIYSRNLNGHLVLWHWNFSKNHGEGCDFENLSVDRVDNQLWFGIKYVKIEWFNEEIDFFSNFKLTWLLNRPNKRGCYLLKNISEWLWLIILIFLYLLVKVMRCNLRPSTSQSKHY